jgi:hypothetical protein
MIMALHNSHGPRFEYNWPRPGEGGSGGATASPPAPESGPAPKQAWQMIQDMAASRPYVALAVALGLGVTLGWLIKRR